MRSIRALALATSAGGLALVTVAAFTACSSSSSQGPSSGGGVSSTLPFAGPDEDPPAGTTLQPDVVVVHGGTSALQAMSADHGVWTLNKSASGVSQLAPGKVVLIAGLDCARVTAVQDNGSTLDVTVEPVAFTDVLQEADLAWNDAMVDISHGYLGQVPYATVVAAEQTPDAGADGGCEGGVGDAGGDAGGGSDAGGDGGLGTCLRLLDDTPKPGTAIKLTIGNWVIAGNIATNGSGVDESLTMTWTPGMGGGPTPPGDPAQFLQEINTSVSVKLHVPSVQGASGAVSVHGGAITSGSFNAPVGSSVDVGVQVSTPMGGQFVKRSLLKLPIAAEWPIFLGGIPMYMSFQANLLIQPSLSTANATMGLTSHIDATGSSGLKFSAGTAIGTSTPSVTTPANPLDNLMAPPSVGTQAMVVAVEAPRVGIGIGTMAFGVGIKAGIFVDLVNSFAVTVASSTALVPCQSVSWFFNSQGGGEWKIKGAGLSGSTTIDLSPPMNTGTWYSPMIAACKP
jgi:hypothetical protein